MDLLFTSNYMDYLNDMPQQLMDKMWFDPANIPVFIAWIVAYITGFLLYTYAGKVGKEQGVEPYPIWIHCFMIAIDIYGTITFWLLAATHDWYWYFIVQGIALPMWIVMEWKSIKTGIKNKKARQMEWGNLVKGEITERQAWFYAIGTFAVSMCLIIYALHMLGGMSNAAIWIIYPFTNYVYAIWTWRFWDARSAETGVRAYNSVGLQVVIVATCIVSWCPGICWYWTVSPFFHTPQFYLGGIACTAVALYNLYKVRQLPEYKPESKEGEAIK